MTLVEKAAQLSAAFHNQLIRPNGTLHGDAEDLLTHGLGSVSRMTGWGGRTAEQAAGLSRALQTHLIEGTRLGVPALIHEEALSGLAARGATVYPQALTLAATFNPALVREIAERIREEMVACGVRQALSPVLDVVRDPRWGRTEETFGEDPYLVASLGVAYVVGLQGGAGNADGARRSLRHGVAATLKHFAGHGVPDGGRNAAPIHIGAREFRETDLFPFEAAVKAGARAVMCAYHDHDGVPASIDHELLTTVLRERWGFDGVVVSDYGGILRLIDDHGVASNPIHAGILALMAGVDVELPMTQCYGANLVTAVESKVLPLAVLDRAVLRVLRLKEELGLLDDDWKPEATPTSFTGGWDGPDRRALAHRAAVEGIVLLQNDGVLPITGARTVFLCGPAADVSLALVGDYSYPYAVEEGGVSIPTLREALSASAAEAGWDEPGFSPGSGLEVASDDQLAEVVRGAVDADVVIVALGDRVSKDASYSGEHHDRSELALPAGQAALLDVALASGRPVVCVLATGRPVAEPERFARCAAVLHVGFPGEEGARALVDVLSGRESPSGRTPVSWPRSVGQIPVDYRRHRTSRGGYVDDRGSRGSRELAADPAAANPGALNPDAANLDPVNPALASEVAASKALFAFGHGLSYASFAYSELVVDPPRIPVDGVVTVACVVRNGGVRDADEVVQLYVRDPTASTVRPALELKGFARARIAAGRAVRITFALPADQLSLVNPSLSRVIEPGRYEVSIGRSSADRPLAGGFEVFGRQREVGFERRMFGEVDVVPVD